MNRKKSINAIFIFITLVLFALPLIMTFNNVLTKFVENINFYRLIMNDKLKLRQTKKLLFFFLFFSFVNVFAQKPDGRFLGDSLYIGKPIEFVLTYRHAPETDIFFPLQNGVY